MTFFDQQNVYENDACYSQVEAFKRQAQFSRSLSFAATIMEVGIQLEAPRLEQADGVHLFKL